MQQRSSQPPRAVVLRTTYQIFILLVTLVSLAVVVLYYLVPLPAPVDEVLYILNDINALILLADFAVRLYHAPSKIQYLLPLGLLDLIGSLPGAPFLRLLRVPSFLIMLYKLRQNTAADLRTLARERLAESTLLTSLFVVLLVTTVGGMAIVWVEATAPGANIKTGSDALWYAIVTVSTVGYGDVHPVTSLGRLIGSILILSGVGIFSVITGYISTQFLSKRGHASANELDALRQEMERYFDAQRQAAAADRAALEEQLAALKRELERR